MRALAIAVMASVLVATPARAQISQADALAAESLFREAKDLVGAGKTAEACPKFAESQRLDPQLGTLLYLATCHSQEGKTATAWAEFLQAADQASKAHDDAREKLARERAEKLAPTVPRVTIEVDPANPSLALSIDGQRVRAAGVPIPIDPGAHEIGASAADRAPWSTKLTAPNAGGTQVVRVPVLETIVAKERPAPPPAPRTPTLRYVGYGAAAVGVVALGVGTVFGVKSLSSKSSSDEACGPSGCTQAGLASYDDARSAARICDIAIGVGIVALAAGIVLVITSPSSPPPAASLARGELRF